MNKRPQRFSLSLAAAIFLAFLPAGCLFFGGHPKAAAAKQDTNAAPDRILYDRALNDYKHGHYTESRLSLQTLINSYPDSEYLAKAKLAIADSYYKEGGTEGLTQAVAEYKDFETFFPFLEEAAYAQMQIGMSHYRMMEKPDRDTTQARLAEQEFQTFLLKYPKSPLVPQAEQRLREVQEILSQGDFDVAHFYYVKGDYRASAARLIEVTNRYPLFSQADHALWMMGDIYRRAAKGSRNETERARWRTLSDEECARIVKEYPLSSYVSDAKKQLEEDGAKVPPADPAALARMRYEEKFANERKGIVGHALGMIHTAPDVSMAAHAGEPDLNPPGEFESPQQAFAAASGESASTNPYINPNQNVASASARSVSPGESSSASSSVAGLGASVTVPADPGASSANAQTNSSGATSSAATEISPNTPPPPPPLTRTATDAAAAQDGTPPASSVKSEQSADSQRSGPSNDSGSGKNAKNKKSKAPKPKLDKSTESTSKKKKGIHKLIPW